MCAPAECGRWIPVLFVLALIGWCWGVFMNDVLLPGLAASTAGAQRELAVGLIVGFNAIFALAMLSFLRAVFTDPGRIPDSWIVYEDPRQYAAGDLEGGGGGESGGLLAPTKVAQSTSERKHDGNVRICKKSKPNVYKPDRAHYCKVISRCVLKMDHFCPWLNNCIGFYNHKYFVLFIVYMAAECIFILVVTTPVFMMIINNMEEVTLDLHDAEFHISLTYMMVCLLALGLCAFSGFHLYLLAGNYTTIEFLEKRGCQPPPGHVNRYDLGTWRNVCAVLGDNPLVWPLPVRWTCRGDGLSFPLNPAVTGGDRGIVQYAKKPM